MPSKKLGVSFLPKLSHVNQGLGSNMGGAISNLKQFFLSHTMAMAFLCSLSAVTSSACKPPQVDMSTSPKNYEAHEYEEVWERWTRRDKSYEDIIVNIQASATYWSHDFCYAYAAKYIKLFSIGKKGAKEFRSQLLEERTKHHEFMLAMVTQEPEWNDLGDKESIWRLALINDREKEVEPIDIMRIKPITTTHKTFFPQIELFSSVYRIRFPRTKNKNPTIPPKTKYFLLKIAGPKGKISLKWEVKQ